MAVPEAFFGSGQYGVSVGMSFGSLPSAPGAAPFQSGIADGWNWTAGEVEGCGETWAEAVNDINSAAATQGRDWINEWNWKDME